MATDNVVAPISKTAATRNLRRSVAAAGGKARAGVRHRSESQAVVGRLLHDDVEVAGREPAAACRVAEIRDEVRFGPSSQVT
jgi:hypothetical protein